MIIDFEKSSGNPDQVFDTCIVGAGAAGISIAHELLKAGKRVALLEGGGISRWERKSQALNKTHASGVPFAGAHAGRFRGVGGTTSAWAGQIMEFEDIDFQRREWVAETAWPISKKDLRPYYQRALALEGMRNIALDDAEVWPEIGAEEPDLGECLELGFSRFCPEPKFARLFAPTFNHPNLTLLFHANAYKLNTAAQNPASIESVSFRSLNGREGVCRAGTFVLCLGGIESSRFLLNQAHAPWDKSRLTGKSFQDHLRCPAAEVVSISPDTSKWFFGPTPVADKYIPKMKLSAEAQRRDKLLNSCGMIELHDNSMSTMRTAIQILLGPSSFITPRQFLQMAANAPSVLLDRLKARKNPAYRSARAKPTLMICAEQQPNSESSITLTQSIDKIGLRRANIEWRISDLEIETIRTNYRYIDTFFKGSGLAKLVPDARLFSDDIGNIIMDNFHHCGGTRMAARPEDGVVDKDLCLFGAKNAYVCSASVFPSSGFGNPTHTVIALGVRLADHLIAKGRSAQASS